MEKDGRSETRFVVEIRKELDRLRNERDILKARVAELEARHALLAAGFEKLSLENDDRRNRIAELWGWGWGILNAAMPIDDAAAWVKVPREVVGSLRAVLAKGSAE